MPSTIQPHECNPDPFVKVTFPNGGEAFEHNKAYSITWKSQKTTGNVKIELIKGASIALLISDSENDDGEYTWSVNSDVELGNDYKIRVTNLSNSSIKDESDETFSIVEEFIPDYFLMPSGSGNYISVIDTLFYDDNADTGNYSADFSGEVVLRPGRSDKKVKIEFLSFSIEDSSSGKIWDTLNIYDGEGKSNLIGRWFGNNNPGTIISTAADGALTVTFNSDEATEGAGWKAHVTLESGVDNTKSMINDNNINLGYRNGRVLYQVPFTNMHNVKIDLYSVKGVKIETLVNSTKQKGFYSIPLSERSKDKIAKGIYILNMAIGGLNKSIQIVVK